MGSGDTDGRVAVTTTKYAINKLHTSVNTPWYPWYSKGEVLYIKTSSNMAS